MEQKTLTLKECRFGIEMTPDLLFDFMGQGARNYLLYKNGDCYNVLGTPFGGTDVIICSFASGGNSAVLMVHNKASKFHPEDFLSKFIPDFAAQNIFVLVDFGANAETGVLMKFYCLKD